jgi:hypothetical protein
MYVFACLCCFFAGMAVVCLVLAILLVRLVRRFGLWWGGR